MILGTLCVIFSFGKGRDYLLRPAGMFFAFAGQICQATQFNIFYSHQTSEFGTLFCLFWQCWLLQTYFLAKPSLLDDYNKIDTFCFAMQVSALSSPLRWCGSLSSEWSIVTRPSGLNTITPGPLPVPVPPSPCSSLVELPSFLSQCPTCLVTHGKPAWMLSQTPWIKHWWFYRNQL